MSRRRTLALLAALAALLGGLWYAQTRGADQTRTIGLFTSLPILWSESSDLKGMVDAPAAPHWARQVFLSSGRLVPLNTLLELGPVDALVVAQPRPLLPEENVALDQWVRRGGHLLMFADPMLTQDSAFPLGDRRRPQDMALLSPILARWGLELRFDENQPAGERESAGEGLPVNLPGTLVPRPGGHDAQCVMGRELLVARCRIGKGRATIVADAALLETGGNEESRVTKLQGLVRESLGR